MKKSHIIGILVIAVAIAVLVSTFGQASTYTTFDGAQKLMEKEDDSEIHVVGSLIKNANGTLRNYVYDPLVDPNRCEFVMSDDSGRVEPVILLQSKPTDFEKSEKVVVIGKFTTSGFVASNVLLKCPSKYENTTIE